MAKASESCTQLIIFLCTFPWLLWSFSSISENYKHVLIICQWNNHKGTKSLKKIFLIVACFAQSPSIKFSICWVKVTATERPQLEWKVRAGPGWGEERGLVPAGVRGEGWSWSSAVEKAPFLPAFFPFCLKAWTPYQLFLSPLVHSEPAFGNTDPFSLTPGGEHMKHRLHQAPLLSSFQLAGPKEARGSQEASCLLLHLFSNSIGNVYLSQQRAIQLQVTIQLLFCTLRNSTVTQAPAFHHPWTFFLSPNNTVAVFQCVGVVLVNPVLCGILEATHVWGYFRRNHGTQHIGGFITKVYYSGRMWDRITKGKRHRFWRKLCTGFLPLFPSPEEAYHFFFFQKQKM